MKKRWTWLLSMALVVTVLGACTNGGGGGESSSGTDAENGGETTGEKRKVKLIVSGNVQEFPEGLTKDDNFIIDYWKENSGFDIEFEILPLEGADEKLNAMLVSGEASGIIIRGGTEWLANLVNQDALLPLDEYIKGTSLETLHSEIQSASRIDGKQYSIVFPEAIALQSPSYIVRKDWLLESGMTDQPKTFDEFNHMLQAFKARGDGVVPLGVFGSPHGGTDGSQLSGAFSPIKGMFGIPTEFALRDGKVVYTPILPEAKEYLAYTAQLYKDGMIAKDFAMLDAQKTQEMFIGGQMGLFLLEYPWASKTIIPAVAETGGDARFMDFPTGANGQPSYSKAYYPVSSNVAIAKDTKDVEAHIEFIEFLLKPETQQITNYGIEGQHYTKEGDNIVPTEEGKNIAWSVYYKPLASPDEWYRMYGVMADWAEYYYPTERNASREDVDPVYFMPPQPDLVAKRVQLNTKVDTYYTDVVTGKQSLDSFDAFAQDWLNSGGQEILDGYNKLYQELGSPKFEYKEFPPGELYTGKYLFDGKK